MKAHFRLDDLVARYGGEAFAVRVYTPSVEVAQTVAQRLRKTIAHQQFRYVDNGTAQILQITISIGVAWKS